MTLAIIVYAAAILPAFGLMLVSSRPQAAASPPLGYWASVIVMAVFWPVLAVMMLMNIPAEVALYRMLRQRRQQMQDQIKQAQQDFFAVLKNLGMRDNDEAETDRPVN
jgi:hypothetical protein